MENPPPPPDMNAVLATIMARLDQLDARFVPPLNQQEPAAPNDPDPQPIPQDVPHQPHDPQHAPELEFESEEDQVRQDRRRQRPRYREDPPYRGQGDRVHRQEEPPLRLLPPTFAGKVDPEAYLDWERRMDHLFDCHDYSEARKVAYAAAQLTDHALTWWDRDLSDRRRRHEGMIPSWDVMKFVMKRRYVPHLYHRDLQKRFRKLQQGTRSVEEYYEEFEHLRNRLQLDESEETLMAQFLDGMHDRIVRKIERQHYVGFDELLHLALQIEHQIKRKNASQPRPPARPLDRSTT